MTFWTAYGMSKSHESRDRFSVSYLEKAQTMRQPTIGQVTGWAQPELTPSKKQKTGPYECVTALEAWVCVCVCVLCRRTGVRNRFYVFEGFSLYNGRKSSILTRCHQEWQCSSVPLLRKIQTIISCSMKENHIYIFQMWNLLLIRLRVKNLRVILRKG